MAFAKSTAVGRACSNCAAASRINARHPSAGASCAARYMP